MDKVRPFLLKLYGYGFVKALGILLVSLVLWGIASWVLKGIARNIAKRTKTTIDDAFVEHNVLGILAGYVPFVVMGLLARFAGSFSYFLNKLSDVGIALTTALLISSLLSVLNSVYERHPISKRWPIRGYIQFVKLIVYIAAAIVAVCILINKSPWSILSGLGALSAVLMLVFRHTILSFVATFQVLYQDLVQIGDWIEMPKYGVDGEVIDITFSNLVVRNWDNTVVAVPSYKLLEDSFKNWRGMEQSGGRRIKRAIFIDQSSIKFCDEQMIEKFRKIHLLKAYIEEKLREIEEDARKRGVNLEESPLNGRRLTNIGTFRVYIEEYLKVHPMVRKDMTLMVRQLAPTPQGLPLEVYCFVADTRWVPYEKVQADIFDHILASVPEFGLRIFQFPSDTAVKKVF